MIFRRLKNGHDISCDRLGSALCYENSSNSRQRRERNKRRNGKKGALGGPAKAYQAAADVIRRGNRVKHKMVVNALELNTEK